MGESTTELAEGTTDEGTLQALRAVYTHAETGDGTVSRSDVVGDITSEQWGDLLRAGVLLDTGNDNRFVIDEPEVVRRTLEQADEIDLLIESGGSSEETDTELEDAEDEEGWSIYDKVAGLCALGLAAGYQISPIRTLVGQSVDVVLGPIEAALPFYAVIIVLALATGTISTVLQSRMTDREARAAHQEQATELRERISEARDRGDDATVEQLQDEQLEMMTEQFGSFTQMLRPLAWTMLFTIPVFLWLYWLMLSPAQAVAPTTVVFPVLGEIAWTARVLGPLQAWLVWYSICSITSRQLIQKTLDLHPNTA